MPWSVNQADYQLDGTTDADTFAVRYNTDGGAFSELGSYVAFDTIFSYGGTILSDFRDKEIQRGSAGIRRRC